MVIRNVVGGEDTQGSKRKRFESNAASKFISHLQPNIVQWVSLAKVRYMGFWSATWLAQNSDWLYDPTKMLRRFLSTSAHG